MTEHEKFLVRCAFADLCGAMQAHLQCDRNAHDWKAHAQTIQEMSEAFDFLDPVPNDLSDGESK
jgi:hypothetical protein